MDLNPVRAAIAETPEQSDHTSIKRRVEHWQQESGNSQQNQNHQDQPFQPNDLYPFVGSLRQPMPKGIFFNLVDYLQLVDWTGRQIRDGKVGAISADAVPILKRLSITAEHWVYLCTHFKSRFKGLVGYAKSLELACQIFGRQRCTNLSVSTQLFP